MDTLKIVFHGMDASPAVEARIRERIARIEAHHGRIVSGQVAVEAPHRRSQQGKLFQVKINLNTPKERITVSHEGRRNHAHEDVYVALRDAFDAAERQLESHADRLRGDVKTHAPPQLSGKVARLFPDHGFIATEEGLEVYFNRNSVVGGGFDRLETGDPVRLVVAEGESLQGPQASTVVPRRQRAAGGRNSSGLSAAEGGPPRAPARRAARR